MREAWAKKTFTYTTEQMTILLYNNTNIIKPLCKNSFVNDDNVINLLNYYELVNELKTIHG